MSTKEGQETTVVKTSRFGDFEIPQSSIMTLTGGLIGFPNFTRFVLLDYNPPFSWLHSVENAELAFVVVNAAEFGENYLFPLPIGDRDMDLSEKDEVAVLNLVSVRPDPRQTTANLKAPIIVNLSNMKGKQIVLDDPTLSVRFQLLAEGDSGSASESDSEAK
jgi:flagellar assembly factor FliW